MFVIEGIRELEIALKSGYIIQELYLCPAILQDAEKASWFREHSLISDDLEAGLYGKLAIGEQQRGYWPSCVHGK